MPSTHTDNSNLRALIEFTESAPYELLLSLGAVYWMPGRHQAWVAQARGRLSPELLDDIHYFYDELWHRLVLMELPVDYAGPADDTAGFIRYVAAMDPDTFLFYLWGRIIPRDQIAAVRAQPEQVTHRLRDFYEATWPGSGASHAAGDQLPLVAADPVGTQARLVRLLTAYEETVFRAELPDLRRRWEESLAEKRAALARLDPAVFLTRLLEGRALPPMFPRGVPLQAIRLVPSYYIWRTNFEIWGYGTLYVLYNASRTEQGEQERARVTERITSIAAALSDANRLKILSAIAQDPECYGQKLALMCSISQPAVSRHMGILKRVGLVDEVPSEGRLLYRLRREQIEEFLPQLLQYLDT
ncbi:MAG TPA: ArsR family transcriptional regulator [Chloroflexia bacterium]|nr:ArsR family transcriptional regulator [Chloroflexia bacterium]